MDQDHATDTLTEWVTAVTRELGLEGSAESSPTVDTISELAASVADGVGNTAAPITTHLVRLAAGRADDPAVATRDYAQKITHLAEGWSSDQERGAPANDQSNRA